MKISDMKEKFIKDRIDLFWDIDRNKIKALSDEAVIERIFIYGNLNDYIELFRLFGKAYCKQIFDNLKKKQRVNLQASTVNYLNLILSDIS